MRREAWIAFFIGLAGCGGNVSILEERDASVSDAEALRDAERPDDATTTDASTTDCVLRRIVITQIGAS